MPQNMPTGSTRFQQRTTPFPPDGRARLVNKPAVSNRRDSRTLNCPTPRVNVGDTERLVSAGLGAGLAITGLSRTTLPGLAVAALGGCLVYRGISGHCEMYRALGVSTAEPRGPATSVPS